MTTLTASHARASWFKLLNHAAYTHHPIKIVGKRKNVILVSEIDWRAIQETLYLVSIPRMRNSIRKGLKTPLKKTSRKMNW